MMTRIEATLIPGGLTAVVYDHDLPVAGHLLPCWTIITGGFAALGQQEIALTVLKVREARDKVPPGVFGYLRSLFPLAEQGDFVRDGSVSSWRAPGPLNLGGFVGVAFFDPEPLPGILLPSGALAGVFLKEGEVEMALRCGVQRVLFALGRQARYFPFPHWSDPGREAVYQLGDAGRSVLRVRSQNAFGAAAMRLEAPAGVLSWRWKVDRVLDGARLGTKEGDDAFF